MDRSAEGAGNETRLASYLEHLASSLGHADRRAPFGSYCKGLILPGERKSVEPIAARVEPRRVQGAHQSLHHFVANADPEFWGEVQPPASLKGLDIPSRRAVFVPWKPSRRPAFGMGNPTFR